MPRKLLYRTDWNPYHVTARVNNRELFPIPLNEQWGVFSDECLRLQNLLEVEFHAFVMMPNHIHILLTVPDPQCDLGKAMSLFLSSATLRTNKESGRSGHLFGGPYHQSVIHSSRYFYHALKYVYRNPVKGGLCEKVEDYKFSTFTGLFGLTSLPFPIHYTRSGMEIHFPTTEPDGWVDWLNRPFEKEMESRIQMGLRKKTFGPELNRKTRRLDLFLERDS